MGERGVLGVSFGEGWESGSAAVIGVCHDCDEDIAYGFEEADLDGKSYAFPY